MNIKNYKNIHFIGIGGISMSALAEILNTWGHNVTGSDFQQTDMTEHLQNVGITVFFGHSEKNITDKTDLIVYNAAISEDNPERAEGRRRNIPELGRAELIGELMKEYKFPISVAGTHGKTTTSSMVSEVFMAAGLDPTVSIGGILPSIHSNYRLGAEDYIILETCEYRDSFLSFNPYASIILNIDRDHTDYFKSMEQMYNSFNKFINRTKGFIVVNSEIPKLETAVKDFKGEIITYGGKDAQWQAKNVEIIKGCGSFDACFEGEKQLHIDLSVPGVHNISNALAVTALCKKFGVSNEGIISGLKAFHGTGRRFERKGSLNGALVVDDYAHHPTEIKATLEAAKQMDCSRIVIAFQPHTYTRTKDLFSEFVDALSLADKIYLLDIYAAREKDPGDIHSRDLMEKLKERGKDASYSPSFEACAEELRSELKDGDLFITIGAGPVNKVGEMLLAN
ncbi:MAG: UDP-N-acetylmuramate--L-alanine ligase [Clostridiales bacterium]|nr:UDP-N-acetylmuramate--L-alanine ligase [Clostridiales bacterium]